MVEKPMKVDQTALLEFLGLNLDTFKTILDNIKTIENDEQFFKGLAAIGIAKSVLKDAMEVVDEYELQAKGLINAKAKALYGSDWQVIKGEHFKVSRSFTGQLYEITNEDTVEADFVKVKIAPNAKEIETFRETHDNKLPDGVAINEHRGESIRITVK